MTGFKMQAIGATIARNIQSGKWKPWPGNPIRYHDRWEEVAKRYGD